MPVHLDAPAPICHERLDLAPGTDLAGDRGSNPRGGVWPANLIAAALFGLGHLPATARIAPLTPLSVACALILNGLAGMFFGVLFLRFGLETAILAHFCLDIMVHLIFPELMAGGKQLPVTKAGESQAI
jgi:membrane protease YdiL (CAAX protease family)